MTDNIDFTSIPLDDIELVGQRRMIHTDLFTVSWLLGRFCNYNCSYCWPYARADRKDHRDTDLCLLTIDEIKRQARENGFNSFHFSLSGGEPTFHPGYLDILRHLSSDRANTNYSSIHMTTNMSRKGAWWDSYLEVAQTFDRASITASCHREHVNTEEKLNDFIKKLCTLQQKGVIITINHVMVVDRFDQCWEDAQRFAAEGLNVTLKPQSDPTASFVVDGYTPDMLDILQNGMPQTTGMQIELKSATDTYYMDQAERFNSFNFNRFEGWECSSGYRSIIIREPDGSIKRSYSCRDEPLGYIDKGFRLFDKPQPCITETCVSSADSKIPKRKPNTTHKLYTKSRFYDTI